MHNHHRWAIDRQWNPIILVAIVVVLIIAGEVSLRHQVTKPRTHVGRGAARKDRLLGSK